jgi:hypothetical protein
VNQANVVALLSLVASVFFILALKSLSHPLSARKGNRFGIFGMAMAVVMTLAIAGQIQWALLALTVGGVVGWYVAKRGRDDADARTGRSDALARRPRRGAHRLCRRQQPARLQHSGAAAGRQPRRVVRSARSSAR